jgi:hypothetical protein
MTEAQPPSPKNYRSSGKNASGIKELQLKKVAGAWKNQPRNNATINYRYSLIVLRLKLHKIIQPGIDRLKQGRYKSNIADVWHQSP